MLRFQGHGNVSIDEYEQLVDKWVHDPDILDEELEETTEEEEEEEEEVVEENPTLSGPELFKQYAKDREARAHLPPAVQEEENQADMEEAVAVLSGKAQEKWDELDADQ